MKPKKEDVKIAKIITESMATWTFILLFLFACGIEILGNKSGWFHFDPTMLVLNTILSLLAAIQGSVIMIYQKYQDQKRDETMHRIDKNTEAVLKLEKKLEKLVKEHHA